MMSLLNPGLWLIGIGMAIGLFFSGVSVGKKWEEGRQAVETNHIAEAVDAATSAAAEAIAQIKVKNTTITNEVQHDVQTHTIYADCKLPATGVRLVNAALDPSAAYGFGDSKLPKADAPK